MKRINIIAGIVSMFALMSCQGPAEKKTSGPATQTTILSLFEESNRIDSLVVLYFTDTVKFRYYTFTTTASKEDLDAFRENLTTTASDDSSCVKDGTIYAYINGEIYTTLYFNLTDSCRSLRLFKNGSLYSYPLSNSFLQRLRTLKTQSVSP